MWLIQPHPGKSVDFQATNGMDDSLLFYVISVKCLGISANSDRGTVDGSINEKIGRLVACRLSIERQSRSVD
jgi:hypothetical protein